MADWVDLLLVVKELAGRALLTREEAGAHLQTALIKKEISTRGRLIGDVGVPTNLSGVRIQPMPPKFLEDVFLNGDQQQLNAFDEVSDIPARFWKNITGDWNRDFDPEPFWFFMEGNDAIVIANKVEASRVEALTFLHLFDKVSGTENERSISSEVKNRFTNRGGAPTKYDWVGAAAHIAAFVEEVGLPPVQADLRREVEQFFSYQHRIPDEKDLKQFVGQYYKSAEDLRLRRKKNPPKG